MVKARAKETRASAVKRKKTGSPDENATPSDSPLNTLEKFSKPPAVNIIRGPEIDQLLISENEMLMMRPPEPLSGTKTLKTVNVRKERHLSKIPAKRVSVLKKMNESLEEVGSLCSGPRYTEDGDIIPYSILGSVKDFKQSHISTTGDESVVNTHVFQEIKPPMPITITTAETETEEHSRETNALKHWEQQLKDHARQASYIARKIGKSGSSILMNNIDEYRVKQEERIIVDKTIANVMGGRGDRVGSEFWTIPQRIGDEEKGITITLNKTEQGSPPPMEFIGKPESQGNLFYPWKRNKYFETRKRDLTFAFDENLTRKPEFEGLIVKGKRELGNKNIECEEIVMSETVSEDFEELALEEEEAMPVGGPKLEINEVETAWEVGRKAMEIRVLFTGDAGSLATEYVTLTNTGTTAIFFSWKLVPKENKLNTIMEGNVQRFYFSLNDGVILPEQEIRIPIIFLSKQAGIYTETWEFITKPLLNNGHPIVVTLKGVAIRRDIYKLEKQKIEELLERREIKYNMKLLVDEIVRGIHSPPSDELPPPPPDLLRHERFESKNPFLHYQTDYYDAANDLWSTLDEETPWDESLHSIRQKILSLPAEEQPEKLEAFTALRNKMARTRIAPQKRESFDYCYNILKFAIDDIERGDLELRKMLSLPERVHIEQPPPPEPDSVSEKTAPDNKKGKKDDKKQTKDTKKRHQQDTKPPRSVSKQDKRPVVPPPEVEGQEIKKEWIEISDPVEKTRYENKLRVMVYNKLVTAIHNMTLALEDCSGKSF